MLRGGLSNLAELRPNPRAIAYRRFVSHHERPRQSAVPAGIFPGTITLLTPSNRKFRGKIVVS